MLLPKHGKNEKFKSFGCHLGVKLLSWKTCNSTYWIRCFSTSSCSKHIQL